MSDHSFKPIGPSNNNNNSSRLPDSLYQPYPFRPLSSEVEDLESPVGALKKKDPTSYTPQTKIPWEHPENPDAAAELAGAEIIRLGGNMRAYENAAAWLNDTTYLGCFSEQEFKVYAAEAFNSLGLYVAYPGETPRRVLAINIGGDIQVRDVDAEFEGFSPSVSV